MRTALLRCHQNLEKLHFMEDASRMDTASMVLTFLVIRARAEVSRGDPREAGNGTCLEKASAWKKLVAGNSPCLENVHSKMVSWFPFAHGIKPWLDYHRGPINRGTNFKQEYGPETGLTTAHQILRHLHKDLAPISGTLQGRDQFPG